MKLRTLLGVVALAAVYAVVAQLGLALDAVGGFATLVWPPTGLSLAAVLLWGPRLAPGVFLGACAANLWAGAPVAAALGIATGNTLEALLGAYALGRVGFRPELDRLRDVVALVVLAALLSTLVSAACGVATLRLAGLIQSADSGGAFLAWWIGDLIGALVVGTFCLTWLRGRLAFGGKAAEGAALVASTLVVTALVFARPANPFGQPFLLFPLLVWAALRFGPRGTTAVTLAIAASAVTATAFGMGPFVHPQLHLGLTALQVFVGSLAVGGLSLAGVAAERARAGSELREGYALVRAIVEGTTDAVFVKDRQGRYLFINEAGAGFFGRPMAEVLGQDDAAFFPPELAATVAGNDQDVMASAETRTLEEVIEVGQEIRTFLSTKAPLRDDRNEVIGLVGISRDITPRKRAERLMVEAVEARDEFLSIASHELRTPLSALLLELGGLRRRLTPKEDPDGVLAKRLVRALRQTERLERLVTTLLEVSRISNGGIEVSCEAMDVAALVREVLDRFAEEALQAQCPLHFDGPATLMAVADRFRLDQLVTNFLTNAIKYGRGKPIQLSLAERGADLQLSIRDHGIGLSPSDAKRIFNRFERAVSARHFGGLGLGLFICRQIVEAHGGSITASPADGGGALFVATLPLAGPAFAAAEKGSREMPAVPGVGAPAAVPGTGDGPGERG